MPGIKRKEANGPTAGQSPPKKIKQDGEQKKAKTEDGEKRSKKDHTKSAADGKPKQQIVKELLGAQSSAEAHAKQRALAKERKAAKPNADSIHRAKKIWERLRIKSAVPKEERQKLVAELFDIITGNVKDFVFKHDSVRTVQCAIKYATLEQKKEIARELQGSYRELAESRYAKFLVAKLMIEDKEIREMIISEFYGSVKRLINHPEASWILDDTYRQVATQKQKAILLREWYGAEFALANKNLGKKAAEDDSIIADLQTILSSTPEKRKPITDALFSQINALVQKKMTGFTMLHDAMLQWSLSVSPSDTSAQTALLDLLKPTEEEDNDLLKNLAFTASGARLVRRALAFATAKDRKALLKPYKDHVEMLAHDPHGHTMLLAAMEVVDDTVLVSKFIFPTLVAANLPQADDRANYIVDLAHSLVARIVLLYPLLPASASEKAARWLIQDGSETAQALAELRTLRSQLGTSKKDPEVRRQELAKALLAQNDGALLTAIASKAGQLLETSFGCQFVQEVLLSAPAAVGVSGKDGERLQAAMAAVAEFAAGDPSAEGHLAQSAFGGRMLKTLVQGARFDAATKTTVPVQPALGFANVLFEKIKEHLVSWATGSSSFVVSNMFETSSGFEDGKRKEAVKVLGKEKKRLQEAAKSGNKGAALVVEALDA